MTPDWSIKFDADRFLVYFSFLEMLFLRWLLIGQDTIILLYCGLLCFRLLTVCPRDRQTVIRGLLLAGISGVYILANTMLRETFDPGVFFKNIHYLVLPAIVLLYFGYLINNRLDLLRKVFGQLRVFLNIYLAVNAVIICLQKGNTYFLMPVDRITNDYYRDHMAGLLGLDGTHRLALVTSFVLLLNLYHLRNDRIKQGRKLAVWGSTLFLLAAAVYTSSINDNNMLYVLLVVLVALFYAVGYRITEKTTVILTAAAVTGAAALVLIINSSAFTGLRLNKIMKQAAGLLQGTTMGDERMIYVVYTLQEQMGLLFGQGFGTIRMRFEPSIVALGYDYRNWGMSDIAPLIAMGGLGFYLWHCYSCGRICAVGRENKNMRKFFFLIVLLLTYYHQVLTHVTMMLPMCWIMAVFAMQNRCSGQRHREQLPAAE